MDNPDNGLEGLAQVGFSTDLSLSHTYAHTHDISLSHTLTLSLMVHVLRLFLQVLTCEDVIGWRDRSATGLDRGLARVVLFMTDDAFHYSGEGQVCVCVCMCVCVHMCSCVW